MVFESMTVEELIAWSIIFLLIILLLSIFCVLWRMLRVQRETLNVLETANRINAEALETVKNIRNAPAGEGTPAGQDEEDDEEPADFVYCPECSMRVEVDPSIRDINVVCPDCKKPFHIH